MMWMSVCVFVLGVCIGSFLNVAIFRTHEGDSVVTGRSKCQSCEEPLEAQDLVPVLSYLRLRGKCRRCKSVISWQYPAVELVMGVLFVLAFIFAQGWMQLVAWWILLSFLVVIFVYDLRYMYILDRFTIPAMMVALLTNLFVGVIPAWSLLVGALVIGGFFWIQFAVSRGRWVGGGDIRMGALMGCLLGIEQGLLALFLSYVFGAIVGVWLLAHKQATRKTEIPFGTFLVIGTVISLFVGQEILDWYLGFFR